MRTLLVLAPHPDTAEVIRAGLNPEQYRVLHRTGLDEGEPLLGHSLVDACIVDVELTTVQSIWFLDKLHRRAPKCPVILYTGPHESAWEEEAYLRGATHVLTKPVRARMLTALLGRLWESPAAHPQPELTILPPPEITTPATPPSAPPLLAGSAPPLGVLRDFSAVLTHSLNADAMLNQFLRLLRELLSINRAAIFLRQPSATFGEGLLQAEDRSLRSVCAMGLPAGLLQHFELSFDAGIGGQVFRLGRIL